MAVTTRSFVRRAVREGSVAIDESSEGGTLSRVKVFLGPGGKSDTCMEFAAENFWTLLKLLGELGYHF